MSSRPTARSVRERIQDMLGAIAEIDDFVAGMTRDQFMADRKTIRAVELNIIILGEATSAIPDDVHEQHPEIPWFKIYGMRNHLVHGYFALDASVLWDTVRQDLPALRIELQKLLEQI